MKDACPCAKMIPNKSKVWFLLKSLLGTLLFLIVGVVTAVTVGFGLDPADSPVAIDHEQTGLDEVTVIKFSHVVAKNTPKGFAAQLFADLVEEKTKGKVRVEVFPNGLLYTDGVEMNALIEGDVQMIAPAFSKVTPLFPEWQVLDLPYAFPNHKALEEAFSGEIGEQLFQLLEQQNIKGLAFWDNGFKQITSSKRPLILPEDFEGQRFRIMPSKLIEAQYRILGVETKVMNFNQVFRGLEIKYLDGQENTISNIYSKKFYTVQDYMTISNHGYIGYAVLMNGDFWNSLPQETQKQISEAMDETTAWLRQNAIQMNQRQLDKIKKESNIQIHIQTPEERALWMKRLDPVYSEFEQVIGSDLMDMVKALRQKYTARD
jgi:tripartite ATP-independent transporter DctP family solute receptor